MPKSKLPYKEFKWTPPLAYAIGLLVTDGNLSKDGRHITMTSVDRSLLKTFKLCLKIKNKITPSYSNGYSKRICYRIQFSDVRLYNWLLNIGITPAKTHTIGALNIPKNVFRDFLRGHLDGDGYIQNYTDNYNIYRGIRWLYKMIKKCLSVKGALLFKKPLQKNRVPMWEIKFAKYDSLKLFKWFYYKQNLPALARKRKIAEDLLKRIVNNKLIR